MLDATYLTRYDPFGNYRTWPGSNVNPLISDRGFTGHVHDNTGVYPTQNVGLIYMNARYYLPEVGRFVSPDSIVPDPNNPQSYNRYSYVRNSPLNFTDPTGHRECLNSGANGCTDIAPHGAYESAQSLADLLSPEPIFHGIPIQNPEWTNGFGPNSFARTHRDFYISESAGIHPGIDFGKNYDPNCAACMTVYATVSGTISEEYGDDADPNVVIDLGNGMFVIYGHVEGSLPTGTKVEAGSAIGLLVNQSGVDKDGKPYDNTHVHLSLRQGGRTFNPAYFFSDPSVLDSFTFRYPTGESLYSISSYKYGSGTSYWDPVADPWNAARLTRW